MKKTLALALTAAMAISAVSTTAFAASVSVKSDVEPWEREATAKIVAEDVGQATSAEVKSLPTLDSDDVYKFVGWDTTGPKTEADYAGTTDPAVKKTYGDIFGVAATVADGDKDTEVTLYPVFRRWKNQKELDKWKEDQGKGADDEAKKKAFEDKLKAADESHNATNNHNTGKKIETAQVDAGDPQKWATADSKLYQDIYHDAKVANLGNNDVAFYYQPVGFEEGNLISGKNVRINFKLPDDYTTDNCDVTVYKVDGWCNATKVKKADMMTNGKDIYVWANSTGGRYVIALSPKGASAGSDKSNPATGDFSALPVAMLAVAALGATGFVAYKKRKAE